MDLPVVRPEVQFPTPYSTQQVNALMPMGTIPHDPIAYSDSDWGLDFAHRKSIGGLLILLAGAVVIFKTLCQKVVALSSTEAEFVGATEAGKLAL
jgi:hypothetical protein